MIQITVKPQVLLALQVAFPKPANSASRALNKYIRVLEDMIFNSLQHVQTPLQRKLGLFPIGLKELRNLGALTIVLMLVNLKYAHVHQFHLNRRLVLGAASFCSELAPG